MFLKLQYSNRLNINMERAQNTEIKTPKSILPKLKCLKIEKTKIQIPQNWKSCSHFTKFKSLEYQHPTYLLNFKTQGLNYKYIYKSSKKSQNSQNSTKMFKPALFGPVNTSDCQTLPLVAAVGVFTFFSGFLLITCICQQQRQKFIEKQKKRDGAATI